MLNNVSQIFRKRFRDLSLKSEVSGLKSRKGFTLFELMVTIAIVALLVSLVISGVQDFLETDMKKASARMASTMRYLYNKSVTEGLYIRLVLNLDEQTYWVEASRDPVLMTNPQREETSGKTEEKEKEGEEGQVEQEEATTGPRLPKLEMKKPQFSQVETYLLKPTRLPDGIFYRVNF